MNKVNFIFLDGSQVQFDLTKDNLIVGRDPSCDIVLPFQGFSRRHIRLEFKDGKIYVTDLKSSNGVMINGKKISPGSKTLFNISENLQFGPLQSTVFMLENSAGDRVNPISLGDMPKTETGKDNDESTRMMQIPKLAKEVGQITKKSTLVQLAEEPKSNSKTPLILGAVLLGLVVVGFALYQTGII